jgi:hypothetical protein
MNASISKIRKRLWLCMLAGVMAVFGNGATYAQQASGPTFFVLSTADDVDAHPGDGLCATARGECTLRAAIMELNTDPIRVGTALLVGGSTYTLTIKGSGEDNSLTGDLDIKVEMKIKKDGAEPAIVQGGNAWNDRIFHLLSPFGGTTIDGIQIQNGHADTPGGGIRSEDTFLVLNNSTVTGNSSPLGGGIACTGTAHCFIISSTVSGNTAEVKSSSTSADGGGIWNSGSLDLRNSTISGNKATGSGGGIVNISNTTVNNTTIANNVADSEGDGIGDGGGVFNGSRASFVLRNTILAGNLDQSPATKLPDCAGALDIAGLFDGYNLIQSTSGCTLIAAGTIGFFTNIRGKSPLLGPLQNNGGPTFTHAAGSTSPAVDAGSASTPGSGGSACFSTDQRGRTRPIDGNGDGTARCDIGAYEAPNPLLRLTIGVPSLEPIEASVYAGQRFTYNFGWTVPGPGWRVLDKLQLRISDERGVALWVQFQEITGSQGTLSLINPQTGEPGPAFAPGSPNRLDTSAATLYLDGSSVDGPPGSRVGLSLDLSFKPLAAGRTFQVEVLAIDDTGQQQDFTVVGVLTVQ